MERRKWRQKKNCATGRQSSGEGGTTPAPSRPRARGGFRGRTANRGKQNKRQARGWVCPVHATQPATSTPRYLAHARPPPVEVRHVPQPARAVGRPGQQHAPVLRAGHRRHRGEVQRLVRGQQAVRRGLGRRRRAAAGRLEEGDAAAGAAEADVLVRGAGDHDGADADARDLFFSAEVSPLLLLLLVIIAVLMVVGNR